MESADRSLAVGRLRSGSAFSDDDRTTEAVHQATAHGLVEDRRALDVEPQFDARRGSIGVLTSGTAGGVESPLQLGIGDVETQWISGSDG